VIRGSAIFNAQRPGHNERNIPASPVPSQDPFTRFLGLTLSRTDPFTCRGGQGRDIFTLRLGNQFPHQCYRVLCQLLSRVKPTA
jgi:hypothetical protein